MMTVPIFHSLYFPFYEYFKSFYSNLIYGENNKLNSLVFSLASGTTAVLCDTITNPMWVVRVRHQTEFLYSGNNIDKNFENKESFNLLKEVYKLYKKVSEIKIKG